MALEFTLVSFEDEKRTIQKGYSIINLAWTCDYPSKEFALMIRDYGPSRESENLILNETVATARTTLLELDAQLEKDGIEKGIPDYSNEYWPRGMIKDHRGMAKDMPIKEVYAVVRWWFRRLENVFSRYDDTAIVMRKPFESLDKIICINMKIAPPTPMIQQSHYEPIVYLQNYTQEPLVINSYELAILAAELFEFKWCDFVTGIALRNFASYLKSKQKINTTN
jgi:hypothetical protein